jgi:hypothetical protein
MDFEDDFKVAVRAMAHYAVLMSRCSEIEEQLFYKDDAHLEAQFEETLEELLDEREYIDFILRNRDQMDN